MCGLTGYMDLRGERPAERTVVERMTAALVHRGPDSAGFHLDGPLGLGFRRLRILDLASGDQPLYNEDGSIVLVCNGEIFNYRELRAELQAKGHVFRTNTDVEVLVHLYEEHGVGLLQLLNGQFAFAIHDSRNRTLFLARDPFGINPLYYTVTGDELVFGSEVKALLEHPRVARAVDLTALDQVLSFPGVVPPRTLFKGIASVLGGQYLLARGGRLQTLEYWDLDYPTADQIEDGKPESYYVERLSELFTQAVRYRLQADVPVGLYLSGGMDSSLVAATAKQLRPLDLHRTFSITFQDPEIDEARYQRRMVEHIGATHCEVPFDEASISERLPKMVYHCERPVKESFNTCSLALAEAASRHGVKVVLGGEGADELFAGYVGYRFDQAGLRGGSSWDVETALEDELRAELWGDEKIFYEQDLHALRDLKRALYSPRLNEDFHEFDSVRAGVVNKGRLLGRHYIHQRSYLDFKLRLSDHLLTEHGDHMVMAHSVEGRYPFLDIDLVEFAKTIPPRLKVNGLTEKYILKQVARQLVPPEVVQREKFGFRGPGSPYLLQRDIAWVKDMLSYDRIKRQGYFNPDTIEKLKARYSVSGARLNGHLETDFLMLVLTFNALIEIFRLPDVN